MPPFRLDLTVWALRRRPQNIVDRWDGRTYRRVLAPGAEPVEVAVTQTAPPDDPVLEVTARGNLPAAEMERAVSAALVRMLGLDALLDDFYRFALAPRLGPLVQRFRGVKPPRFPTPFESLVNAIACQQLSLDVGILLLNRLAEAHGLALPGPDGVVRAFPQPEDLAWVRPEALRPLGFNRQKCRALVELAGAALEGKLERLETLDNDTVVERVSHLRGVGRWSAEYLLLRGLGRLDTFPGDDVGARNSLQRWLRLEAPPDYAAVRAALARWHPYEGFVYFHLLLQRLTERGLLS